MIHSKGKELIPLALVFLVMVASLLLFGLDRAGLFDVDEAIFAQASLEMLQNDDFVKITYNGEPRYHKPPFIYWLQALSMQEFGVGAYAVRLPSAVLGVLTLFGFFFMLDHMTRNLRFALIASAVLALNLSFLVVAQAATADMALNFFSLMLTMVLLQNVYAKQNSFVALVLAGLLLAGGLLAKGPVVLLVPGVVGLTLLVLRLDDVADLFRRANPLVILPVMLVGLLPWVLGILQAEGAAFFKEFILEQNLQRFFGGFGNTQSSSPFYYVWVLLVGFFPWVLFLPGALLWILPDFLHRIRSQKAEEALPALGLVWFVAVTVFFSFSQTKLAHYIVPGYAGAALLLAARLEALPKHKLVGLNVLWTFPVIMLFAAVFMVFKFVPDAVTNQGWLADLLSLLSGEIGFAWPVTDTEVLNVLGQNVAISLVPMMVGLIVLVACFAAWALMHKGYRQGLVLLGAGMWMALFLMKLDVVPTVYAFQQQPLARLAQQLKATHQPGEQVFYLSLHHPSVRFISGVPFIPVDSVAQLNAKRLAGAPVWVVTEEKHATSLIAQLPLAQKVEKTCEAGYCLIHLQ